MAELVILKKADGGCLLDFSDEDEYINLDKAEASQLLDTLQRVKRILTPYPMTTGFIAMDDTGSFSAGFQFSRMTEEGDSFLVATVILDDKLKLKIVNLPVETINGYIRTLIN